MYTPPQWRVAFPATFAVLVALAAGLMFALQRQHEVWAGLCGGATAGVLVSISWAVRHFAPKLSAAVVGAAAVPALLPWLLSAGAGAVDIAVAAVLFGTWYLVYDVGVTGRANAEIESDVVSFGAAGGARRALIVYHSTHGGFQPSVLHAFGHGLQMHGWQVDMTTASHATPLNLSAYDLLVLGAPSYNWQPARPVLAYLGRLGDLKAMPVALVISGGGMTERALKILSDRVTQAHGRIVEALEIWTTRPNAERYGLSDPQEIMRQAGTRVATSVPAR
jgi:hypothetical protein